MQSIRRAAFRSAVSASRTISSTTRSTPFASQIARTTIAPVARPSLIISARLFSQTGRVANEEKVGEESEVKPTEEATEVAEDAVEAADKGTEAVKEIKPGQETPYGVFVRNLVFDVNEQHIISLFEKFGEVNRCHLARDAGKLSKGFAFVYFTNEEAQREAIRSVDGTFWHGRRLYVQEKNDTGAHRNRRNPSGNEPARHLYVGNIPYDTTDATLNELFGSLEGVTDVRVAVDRTTGWPRGFCHIDFRDVEAATKAVESLKGRQLGDRILMVDFASPPQGYKRQFSKDKGDGSQL